MPRTINTILEEFGEFIGLPDLALDAQNTCLLSFDELVIALSWRPDEQTILLFCDIGTLPPQPDTDILIRLLEANCLQRQTAGGAIGLARDDSRDLMVAALSRQIPAAGLDQQSFQNTMLAFISAAEEWQRKLINPQSITSPTPDPDTILQTPPDMPVASIRA